MNRRINLNKLTVIIADAARKKFSIHPGRLETSITEEVYRLQKEGRDISCYSTELSGNGRDYYFHRGYTEVDDARIVMR
jgi:hypothetical protein